MTININISINVDPKTGEVVVQTQQNESKEQEELLFDDSFNCDALLTDNKLKLSKRVIDLLGATIGDRILLSYEFGANQQLVPILSINDFGNQLKKDCSILCKGKNNETLAGIGTRFVAYTNANNKHICLKPESDIKSDIPDYIQPLDNELIITDILE